MATDREIACFEAGVKFGTLYHQFTGTPITPETAPGLAAAIEDAIENQPHCVDATVEVHPERIDTTHGYDEFTGDLIDAEIVVEYEGVEVVARMEMEDGYPKMAVVSVE